MGRAVIRAVCEMLFNGWRPISNQAPRSTLSKAGKHYSTPAVRVKRHPGPAGSKPGARGLLFSASGEAVGERIAGGCPPMYCEPVDITRPENLGIIRLYISKLDVRTPFLKDANVRAFLQKVGKKEAKSAALGAYFPPACRRRARGERPWVV